MPEDEIEGQQQTPKDVTIQDRQGNAVTVPYDKLVELAGRGLDLDQHLADVESTRRELEAQRNELKGDERRYQGYLQLQAAIDTNPDVGRAVAAAVSQPAHVLRALQQGGVADDPDDDDGPSGVGGQVTPPAAGTPDPALLQKLSQLESTVSVLTQQHNARSQQDQARELVTQVDTALQSHAWLSGKTRENVQRAVMSRVSDPKNKASVETIVLQEAQAAREALEEVRGGQLARTRERQALRTATPEGAPGGITPPAKLDKNSFKDGTLDKAVAGALDDFLGTMQGN